MKECIKCGSTTNKFNKNKNHSDGLMNTCAKCLSESSKAYRHSLVGLSRRLYHNQVKCSERRNHPLPNYTEEDFLIWMIKQDSFDELLSNWKESGYKSKLKPSGDRLNDYLPYTFDNLQLITWGENEAKFKEDVRTGKNNKKSKACLQFDLDGTLITEHHSIKQAGRVTGITPTCIGNCCKHKHGYKTAGGFIWEYK